MIPHDMRGKRTIYRKMRNRKEEEEEEEDEKESTYRRRNNPQVCGKQFF